MFCFSSSLLGLSSAQLGIHDASAAFLTNEICGSIIHATGDTTHDWMPFLSQAGEECRLSATALMQRASLDGPEAPRRKPLGAVRSFWSSRNGPRHGVGPRRRGLPPVRGHSRPQ